MGCFDVLDFTSNITEFYWGWIKNLKIKIYRTIILPAVFMGVKLGR
jgi:hypothetical protein